MKRSLANCVAVLVLGLGLTLGLLWLLNSPVQGLAAPSAAAAPHSGGAIYTAGARHTDRETRAAGTTHTADAANAAGTTRTVCPAGPPACDHAIIQDAVDAAVDGDLIKVATGIYTGVHARPDFSGWPSSDLVTQVVHLSKSIAIFGGYTATFTDPPDPESNPATVDAQEQGRVFFITGAGAPGGSITVTIAGLWITGGDATGLGWPSNGHSEDMGGGVFAISTTLVFSSNQVFSNTATQQADMGRGGGLGAIYGNISLIDNIFSRNVANLEGGAIHTLLGSATIEGNTISENSAGNYGGGGVDLVGTLSVLENNRILSNTTSGVGGGLALSHSDAELTSNTISGNYSYWYGGGVRLHRSDVRLTGNIVSQNTADLYGGGAMYIQSGSDTTLINNLIIDNWSRDPGSGLYIDESSSRLMHNTIARNRGADGSGLYVTDRSSVVLSNTILVSQTVGIRVTAGNTATLEGTLWGSGEWANGTDWVGAGTIVTGTTNVWGDPAFVDPDAGDYHIGAGSAAIDVGVDVGVMADMDGEPRPVGMGYDIGADELQALIRYVATDGLDSGDCSTPSGRCLTVQYAVDQAWDGDDVRVASGVYSGVHGRPAPAGYDGPATITQVVYISKSLTMRGGYTVTNWTTANPVVNPTTLDAVGQGRVLFFGGSVTATVDGVRITSGNAIGLGGSYYYSGDAGGGIYVITAAVTVRSGQIDHNAANHGGGVHLLNGDLVLTASAVHSNTAFVDGGGVMASYSAVELQGNSVRSNTAGYPLTDTYSYGGGLLLDHSDAVLEGNTIASNSVAGDGGGMATFYGIITLDRNSITGNHAGGNGGAVSLGYSPVTVTANTILSNTAALNAVFLYESDATLINNLIADNQVDDSGSGVFIYYSSPRFLHNTIARNGSPAGDGVGIKVASTEWEPGISVLFMTNTVLVSHAVGIDIAADNLAILEGTLWGSDESANGTDLSGEGLVLTGTVNVWGDPTFVDPDAGDYHLGPGSAAINAGVESNVLVDVDGESRPVGIGVDIGADEYPAGLRLTKRAFPDPVQAGAPLTYTIHITNNGSLTLTTTITDLMPGQVTPSSTLTWGPVSLLPGGTWTETVAVTVEQEYGGTLVNVVEVTTAEGATGIYTETSSVLFTPPNQAPNVPTSPMPYDGATAVPITQTLSWQGGDPDGDLVTYTVALGASEPLPIVTTTLLITYTPVLTADTTTYWIITATDGISVTIGELWHFTTVGPTWHALYLPLVLR